MYLDEKQLDASFKFRQCQTSYTNEVLFISKARLCATQRNQSEELVAKAMESSFVTTQG